MSKWNWQFENPQHEERYRAWRTHEAIPYFRIACLAATGTWMLGIIFSYLGMQSLLRPVAIIFVFVALPMICCTLALTYMPSRSKYMIPLGALTNGGAGLAGVWVVDVALNIVGAASALMVFVAFFSFVLLRLTPLSAVVSVFPGIGFVVGSLIIGFRAGDVSQLELTFFIFMQVAALLSGVFACFLLELMMRRGFSDKCIIEQQQQELLEERAQLSRFLAPEIAQVVKEKGISAALCQKSVVLTVVSCDLRGFTQYTEHNGPAMMSAVLTAYYEKAVEIARQFGATIKDFVGDGILILVGAPLERTDHEIVGLNLARQLLIEVQALSLGAGSGTNPLGVGVGVASGRCSVGAIGSQTRLEYTAVGSAVNLSARLCASANSGELLLAPQFAENCGVSSEVRRALELKGFSGVQNVVVESVHELVGRKSGTRGIAGADAAQQIVASDI